MRTRPHPRIGEAATALLLIRYIPLRNQSRLIRQCLVEGRLVRVLPVHAGSPLPGHHLTHMVQDRLITQGPVEARLVRVLLVPAVRPLPSHHLAHVVYGPHTVRGFSHGLHQPREALL